VGSLDFILPSLLATQRAAARLQHGDKSASWNYTQPVSETILKDEASDCNFASRFEKASEKFDLDVLWISREWLNAACHLIDHTVWPRCQLHLSKATLLDISQPSAIYPSVSSPIMVLIAENPSVLSPRSRRNPIIDLASYQRCYSITKFG
jgi:hypothetical protein